MNHFFRLLAAIIPTASLGVSAQAADLIARCHLKGFLVPDGIFTDNAKMTVSLTTGDEPRFQSVQEGTVFLKLNDQLTAGQWMSTDFLGGIEGTWLPGTALIVDKAFDIRFTAPLGASTFDLRLIVNGRRVHQFFSSLQITNQLPVGMTGDMGLSLVGIFPAESNPGLVASFIGTNTVLGTIATDSTFQPQCTALLSDTNRCSTLIPLLGDASVEITGRNSAHLSAFTYHSSTIFQKSEARIDDRTSLGTYYPNLFVEMPIRTVPLVEILSVTSAGGGKELIVLGWNSDSQMSLLIESSPDLSNWKGAGNPITSQIGRNEVALAPFSESTQFFRLVKVD